MGGAAVEPEDVPEAYFAHQHQRVDPYHRKIIAKKEAAAHAARNKQQGHQAAENQSHQIHQTETRRACERPQFLFDQCAQGIAQQPGRPAVKPRRVTVAPSGAGRRGGGAGPGGVGIEAKRARELPGAEQIGRENPGRQHRDRKPKPVAGEKIRRRGPRPALPGIANQQQADGAAYHAAAREQKLRQNGGQHHEQNDDFADPPAGQQARQ